jgi:hypothetical protein
MADAQASVRGQRISNALKSRNQSLYGDIPRAWSGDAKRIAKALIDAGVPIERFSQSTQSTSKYIYLASGEKVRISDHALPLGYESADYDFRIGGDIQSLVERIATPANSADQDRSASQSEMQERSVRADESGSKGPAQLNASGGKTDITANPNFRKWFGDSKVVDAEGEPLVVYHGTFRDFSVFDKTKMGASVNRDDFGFFFTNNPIEASAYADPAMWDNTGPSPNLMPVYLAISNPKRVDITDEERGGVSPASWYDDYGAAEARAALDQGYDGLIIGDFSADPILNPLNGVNETLYVAFRPEQIKSAIGNVGTFDANNPNILFCSEENTQAHDTTDDLETFAP